MIFCDGAMPSAFGGAVLDDVDVRLSVKLADQCQLGNLPSNCSLLLGLLSNRLKC